MSIPSTTISSTVTKPPTPPPSNLSASKRGFPAIFYPLAALALILLFNFLFTENFFQIEVRDGRLFGSTIDILNRGTPVLLLALGMTLVIATGGIDLSVGAVMALSGAVAACIIARPEDSPITRLGLSQSLPAVYFFSLFIALAAGVFNGVLVAYVRLQPIVATLILMVAGRGIAQLFTNGQIPTFENRSFEFLGSGFVFGLPFPLLLALALFFVVLVLIRGSALGLLIEAVGNSPEASRLAGVNSAVVKFSTYVLCALLAGVAGLIATADLKSADVNNTGLTLELDAILAAAIGGTVLSGGRFSLWGSLLGAIIIQTLTTTILARGIPREAALVLKALIVVALCLLQSPQFRTLVLKPFSRRPQ